MKQLNVAPEETIPFPFGDLIAFLRVADHASFSRAAAVLGETKGTISRRISRLEAVLGARLFARTSRSVALTEAGSHFRDSAQLAVETLQQASEHLRRAQDDPEGILRLTAPEDLATHVVPSLLKSFLAAHPRVRVELVANNAILDLASHRLDCALRAAETLADSGYVATRLRAIDTGLFASPSFLAGRKLTRLPPATMLDGQPLLLRQGDTRGDRLLLRDRTGGPALRLTGRPLFQASSYSDVLAAAEEGLGIALLPTLITRRAVGAGRLQRLAPRLASARGHLFLVTSKGLLPARVRAFRDHVKAALAPRPTD